MTVRASALSVQSSPDGATRYAMMDERGREMAFAIVPADQVSQVVKAHTDAASPGFGPLKITFMLGE